MIHVWVRATVDWEDEQAVLAQVPDRFRPRMELWNETIDMPYHLFRHRVKEIAALNHSRMANAAHAAWDEIPDGARLVPVDDDDWFAPDLAEVLEREWTSERAVSWAPSWIGVPADFGHRRYLIRRAVLPFTPPHWTCETNNYALVKAPGTRLLAEDHLHATEWFDGPGRTSVRRLRDRISLHNRNLASQTSMRPTKRRGELDRARLLRRLRAHQRVYRRRLWHRDPSWARPYIAMMADLMDELRPR